MKFLVRLILILFSICFINLNILASDEENSSEDNTNNNTQIIPFSKYDYSLDMNSNSIFFDADSTRFTKDGSTQVFEGNVVAIADGVFITADKIELNKNKLEALGHVVILNPTQVFLADKIVYDFITFDLLLVNGVLINQDSNKIQEISKNVLGFTLDELEYEQKKSERLKNIEKRKIDLRQTYKNKFYHMSEKEKQEIEKRYALLLEQESLLNTVDNPRLLKLSNQQRQRYKARRFYWEKNKSSQHINQSSIATSFFFIKGNRLERRNVNDYIVSDAYWSACKCDIDKSADWGMRASTIFAQPEGYIDFYNAVVEIKGVPVLYLPYLKLPLKSRRQSGFLIPTISSRKYSGMIISQPVFFVISDQSDLTINTELHQKRGTKLGVEYRSQDRKYSGWSLNIAGIRDKEWIHARKLRSDILSYWMDSSKINTICTQDENYDTCVQSFKMRFQRPINDWRGMMKWKGLSIMLPRLSFVGHGSFYSDHRYIEDLKIIDDLESAFIENSYGIYFSTSKIQLHHDNKDYYVGIGSSFGDMVLMDNRYQGYQTPLKFSAKTRYFLLTPKNFIVPMYASLDLDSILIKDYKPADKYALDPNITYEKGNTLSDGWWNRIALEEITPVGASNFININHFFTAEHRYITHSSLSDDKDSYINSLVSGIHLNIPLIGTMPLFKDKIYKNIEDQKHFLKHDFSWGTIFSIRPYVIRRGDYAKEGTNNYYSYELVYFASDRTRYISDMNDISSDDTMIKHQKITLYFSNFWSILKRGFIELDNTNVSDSIINDELQHLSYDDRAKLELRRSLRHYPKLDMFEDLTQSFEDQILGDYKLTNLNEYRFANLYTTISYDFWLAKERQKILDKNKFLDSPILKKDLPQPWSLWHTHAGFYLFQSSIGLSGDYNLYYEKFVKRSIGITFSSFYSTSIRLGYTLENEPDFNDVDGSINWVRTHTYTGNVNSSYFKRFNTFLYLAKRVKTFNLSGTDVSDLGRVSEYETKFGVNYYPSSGCWNLTFLRWKKFNFKEQDAEYWLRLSILFLGNKRDIPGNLATPINKKLSKSN